MDKIIPFKKDIIFKTNLSEITSISLEHNLNKEGISEISGNFVISGQYKIADTSVDVEDFSYELPFSINLDEKYILDKAEIDIDDFYYEIVNDSVLSVNIDVIVTNLEERIVEKELVEELEPVRKEIMEVNDEMKLEEKVEEPRCIEDEDIPNTLFDNISTFGETYKSYKVYIVREGDTLETILEKYNKTKEEIEEYNDLNEMKLLYQPNMKELYDTLKEYDLKPKSYQKLGKAILVGTNNGHKYVVKEKVRDNNTNIYKYLESRSFNYYPKILSNEMDDYEITEYVEETPMPDEQKMTDMIDLLALLHNKTTFYKEVDEADYKKIYEDVSNNIEYLFSYYNDLITIIDSKVYMSPSEYLLARNITKIFSALAFCKEEIKKWFDLVKDKKKQRLVVLHNNLGLDHFLKNKNSYLISWNKSRIDIPIFDLYKLYRKQGLDYDFETILKHYESHYPLLKEERKLFFILSSLPNKIEFNKTEYEMCRSISREIDLLYKTEKLMSPYYSENEKENKYSK